MFVMQSVLLAAMGLLPLGAVRPEGHLLQRLEAQRDGLTGHAEEIYEDIGKSDWLTHDERGGEYSWERGPYYARGLIALAFALDDPALKKRAAKWVEATLASQRPNGDFGPLADNWWANMIPLDYLRDWADATGDIRIVPFLERYFRYQQARFAFRPLDGESCWACARGGDEVESIIWLHEKTGDAQWLAFAGQVVKMTADWTSYYQCGGDPGRNAPNCGGYRAHVVNFMQGLKTPMLRWVLFGDERDKDAAKDAFDPSGWAMRQCGRPDGMLNGSEPLSDRSASAGTELCAIVERISSLRTLLEKSGDLAFADELENATYNALSATVPPDAKGIRYYLLLNQPMCVNKELLFANNGCRHEKVGAICPGPHSGFGCCRSNWHVAWPRFVQAMWMKKDGGIAAVVHGPSRVCFDGPTGKVMIRECTDYPYSGRILFRVEEGGGFFPVFVRVPRWARVTDAGRWRRYDRNWKVGDSVEVDFRMGVDVSFWDRDAVCVKRGPLIYALRMESERAPVMEYEIPYEKRVVSEDVARRFPRWEITARSEWNYVLQLDAGNRLSGCEVLEKGEIRVRARRTHLGGWGYMRADAAGRAVDPPSSPVDEDACTKDRECITLVPLSETDVRITLFPWTGKRDECLRARGD